MAVASKFHPALSSIEVVHAYMLVILMAGIYYWLEESSLRSRSLGLGGCLQVHAQVGSGTLHHDSGGVDQTFQYLSNSRDHGRLAYIKMLPEPCRIRIRIVDERLHNEGVPNSEQRSDKAECGIA